MSTLLQIRQVAHLMEHHMQPAGSDSTRRSTQTTPSRDLTLGVMQRYYYYYLLQLEWW
jgi:hypothetical protein